ncbi:MAG: hypothetical protein Q8N01_03170 [Sulfuricurvum sp.]|jgi:hypothetical protein|nr:hypothetical protein [Sulfuricurvum sp.]MDP3023306.1 hypothetical protein [Sulfuricurvum sp.]MDP3119403.1 hypothetical protein [Sulfuricurvum sp.]
MAIGPIGNTIYVNQQMASVASDKNAQLNRFELQALAAQVIMQDQEKEVLEVRPTEENHAVDPDREHTKEQAEQEERRSEDHENTSSSEEEKKPLHILDIKV